MSEAFLCCNHCFEEIAKRDTRAARMWLDLCSVYHAVQGVFAIKDIEDRPLRFLERGGFVTSTEDGSHIAIRVNGYFLDAENNEIFCINKDHV
jgi:hypothetical protein